MLSVSVKIGIYGVICKWHKYKNRPGIFFGRLTINLKLLLILSTVNHDCSFFAEYQSVSDAIAPETLLEKVCRATIDKPGNLWYHTDNYHGVICTFVNRYAFTINNNHTDGGFFVY